MIFILHIYANSACSPKTFASFMEYITLYYKGNRCTIKEKDNETDKYMCTCVSKETK